MTILHVFILAFLILLGFVFVATANRRDWNSLPLITFLATLCLAVGVGFLGVAVRDGAFNATFFFGAFLVAVGSTRLVHRSA